MVDANGAVIVVTGAARGIGKTIAKAFAERGSRVAVADILGDEVAKTAEEINRSGGTALPIAADTTDLAQVEAMAERAEAGLGPIDVAIHNAGTFSVIGPVWEVDPERWFHDIRTNLYGTFLCCHVVARRMVARGSGYIINILGGGVSDPHPYSTSYASSKTGLMRLTEGLARETEEVGVKVFALAPPTVLTEMTRFIMSDPGGQRWRPTFKDAFDQGWDRPPEVVANMALRLVSGEADALTGRYFEATRDFDAIIADAEQVLSQDLLTLRIRE